MVLSTAGQRTGDDEDPDDLDDDDDVDDDDADVDYGPRRCVNCQYTPRPFPVVTPGCFSGSYSGGYSRVLFRWLLPDAFELCDAFHTFWSVFVSFCKLF